MSQPSLPFAKITTEAWRAQVQQTAAAAAVAAAVRPAAPAARPVGRPKRALNAPDILSAAAAAEQPETEQPSKKPRSTVARGKYTNWFDSPYINDILRAYEHSGYRPFAAVAKLQKEAPDDRYKHLSHASLKGWHDEKHQLLPRFLAHYQSGQENVRQNGPVRAFEVALPVYRRLERSHAPRFTIREYEEFRKWCYTMEELSLPSEVTSTGDRHDF